MIIQPEPICQHDQSIPVHGISFFSVFYVANESSAGHGFDVDLNPIIPDLNPGWLHVSNDAGDVIGISGAVAVPESNVSGRFELRGNFFQNSVPGGNHGAAGIQQFIWICAANLLPGMFCADMAFHGCDGEKHGQEKGIADNECRNGYAYPFAYRIDLHVMRSRQGGGDSALGVPLPSPFF